MIYADEGVMVALFTVNEADEVQILSSVPFIVYFDIDIEYYTESIERILSC